MSLDIIDHEDVLRVFNRLIAADRPGHAYLLVGPRGVGKTTVARWLAARLLCMAAAGQQGNGTSGSVRNV